MIPLEMFLRSQSYSWRYSLVTSMCWQGSDTSSSWMAWGVVSTEFTNGGTYASRSWTIGPEGSA